MKENISNIQFQTGLPDVDIFSSCNVGMMYTSAKQFFGPMVLTYFRHKVITNQYAVMGTR
jgi:hypothetical protein